MHEASILWEKKPGENFCKNQYSRVHEWVFDGGTAVRASSSPSIVPVPYSCPEAVDPEEAFLASLSACHMLFFLSLAATAGIEVLSYEDHVKAELEGSGSDMEFRTVRLAPSVVVTDPSLLSPEKLQQLHDDAHHMCFLANSVKCHIEVEPHVGQTSEVA